jgi:uncharacterized membrane protein
LAVDVLFSGAMSGAFGLDWVLSGAAVVATLAVVGALALPAAGVIAGAGAGLGIAVAARLAYDPRIVGADLGTTPIFNWLLFGYGIRAAAFGLAAWAMRRAQGEDQPVQIAQALSLMCAALLFFEIRHALNGGDPYAKSSGLIEQGLFATTSLAFSLVLIRLAPGQASPVLYFGSLAFGVISALVTLFGLSLFENPYSCLCYRKYCVYSKPNSSTGRIARRKKRSSSTISPSFRSSAGFVLHRTWCGPHRHWPCLSKAGLPPPSHT